MPNPVNVSDLEARFRSLTDVESDNAQSLLDDAWELLLLRVPDLDARVLDGSLSSGLVRYVMREALIPVLRNPEGISTWAVDDYRQTRDSSVASGRLTIPDDLINLLMPGAGTRRGAFSVTPGQVASAAPASESEYVEYLRSGSPYGTYPAPYGAWPS